MPRAAVSHKHLASELARCLDDNELDEFLEILGAAQEVGYNLDEHYGKEVGYKTILHLAIDEDDFDATPYVEALLKAGASARHVNQQLVSTPLHAASLNSKATAIKLLLKFPSNKADVNAENKMGLTPIHILLAQLLDSALLQNKPANNRPGKMSDDDLENQISDIFASIQLICMQKELRFDFDHAPPMPMAADKLSFSYRKVSTMTPLQILCSFQIWNAKPITVKLHKGLAEVVDNILNRGVDPNATATKNAVVGSVAGSTPPVFLAATRGYHQVVEVFKRFFDTNFLIENKFQQTILHMVLKAGYNNKILVHGDECGHVNEQTIYTLLSDNNMLVKYGMKSIINRVDSSGNTALHYAKHYPNQDIVKFLLRNGARIHRNPQGSMNVMPRVLEDHFFEDCMEASGGDADDEDFFITIKFGIFAKPDIDPEMGLEDVRTRAQAWAIEMEKRGEKGEDHHRHKRQKVDTKRLEHFGDVAQFRDLLKHPVISGFLEMELSNLRSGYVIDFLFYLIFVAVIFKYFAERFTSLKSESSIFSQKILLSTMEMGSKETYDITVTFIVISVLTLILILREIYQLFKLKKRYFTYFENFIEWIILGLVIFSLLPSQWVAFADGANVQRHLAAFTFLLAFMQLYLLLVKIVPNTPIPLYINMFTTVLKSYTFILLSYFAFLLSFAFSFTLIFSDSKTSTDDTEADSSDGAIDHFGNLGYSLMKTIIMFSGEMDYTDLNITHWLGYLIFAIFVFLMVIVMMNLLNGLAVSDIHKIQKEVDTYYHVNIIETLAQSRYVPLLAEEIRISPNIKPENQQLCGINIPGEKKYLVQTNGKHTFYLHESTVKAAKEVVMDRQAASRNEGESVTLDMVGENLEDMKREQGGLKVRIARIEETLELIMEIMQSRRPAVDRN